MLRRCVLFFFQAEDGIRDGHVTGVQTCALPISSTPSARSAVLTSAMLSVPKWKTLAASSASAPAATAGAKRSEERRVGKECRSGWAPREAKQQEQEEGRRKSSRQEEKLSTTRAT